MTEPERNMPPFAERRVERADGAKLHVRDFPGSGPTFVMMHGFPDNARIYDELIPFVAVGGRRVVTLDFMGFGASDKPDGAVYSFAQQLADLEAVVDALGLERVVTVGHDAGGPAAVNFALKHPRRTTAVVLMNAFYDDAPGLRVPELIELFSTGTLKALQQEFLASPQQFAWLVDFQRQRMQEGLSDDQKARYDNLLAPIINDNFTRQPSAAPAFAQMTDQLQAEVAANTARLVEFRRSGVPLLLIWGRQDPYLHVSVAEHLRSQAKTAALHAIDAGHWPQVDAAAAVAHIMLAGA